jgi:hypothetical protein
MARRSINWRSNSTKVSTTLTIAIPTTGAAESLAVTGSAIRREVDALKRIGSDRVVLHGVEEYAAHGV